MEGPSRWPCCGRHTVTRGASLQKAVWAAPRPGWATRWQAPAAAREQRPWARGWHASLPGAPQALFATTAATAAARRKGGRRKGATPSPPPPLPCATAGEVPQPSRYNGGTPAPIHPWGRSGQTDSAGEGGVGGRNGVAFRRQGCSSVPACSKVDILCNIFIVSKNRNILNRLTHHRYLSTRNMNIFMHKRSRGGGGGGVTPLPRVVIERRWPPRGA